MQAYDDLKAGRFVVIADFESPQHMQLFRLDAVSPEARRSLDPKGGCVRTGTASLRFTAGSPDDAVVIDNRDASDWYLKRDWRPYDLLVMGVHAPRAGLVVDVAIAAGPSEARAVVGAEVPLDRGWNVVRLDLAEAGERVPLDDVREVRLSVHGSDEPTTVHFDDIVLTSNRTDLFGDSEARDGRLYVQQVGRRWRVGVGGGFELTFGNGQIVAWYNRAKDPYRLSNFVAGTSLGPNPMPPVGVGASGGLPIGHARAVLTHPRILEMNEVRVVVSSDWHFVDAYGTLESDRPFQRWVFAIYRTGQVFVAVERSVDKTQASERVGLAVSLAAAAAADADDPRTEVFGDSSEAPVYATASSAKRDLFLLYLPAEADGMEVNRSGEGDEASASISLTADRPASGGSRERWTCQLLLGTHAQVTREEAYARAVAYRKPPAFEFQVGAPARAGEGASASVADGGFDRARGCYRVKPEKGQVRFAVDGREGRWFCPAVTIEESAGKEAWVYVDDLLFKPVARDADGNLIFQLSKTITRRTLVEVLLRNKPADGDA